MALLWAHYPMTGGSLLDDSGNGRHLTRISGNGGLAGPVAAGASPNGQGSLQFGPHNNFDDGPNEPYHGLVTPVMALTTYTVECWIRPSAIFNANHAYAITQSRGFSGNTNQWFWLTYDGALWSWTGSTSSTSPTGSVPFGTWTHVAVTKDSAGSGHHWINGNIVNSFSFSFADLNGVMTVGVDASDVNNASFCDKVFDGLMADLKIWDDAVTPVPAAPPTVAPLLRQRQRGL